MAERYPYEAQLRASAERVARAAGRSDWALVYQSRSGRPGDPWLEPDVCDYLRREAAAGLDTVVLCPLGFLCDHVEVLYDLDVEAAQVCAEIGVTMARAEAVNAHPRFIDALADAVVDTCDRFQGAVRPTAASLNPPKGGSCKLGSGLPRTFVKNVKTAPMQPDPAPTSVHNGTLCASTHRLCAAPFSGRTSLFAQAQGRNQQIQVGPGGHADQMLAPGRQAKTGTGKLRGAVVAADTGSIVRRAQVRISSPDIGSKTAFTDAQGRYEFKDLPAGRFNLSVSKSGFVSMQYGQSRPFEPGRPIDLVDAQLLEKVDVALPRGSVSRDGSSTNSANRWPTPTSPPCACSTPAASGAWCRRAGTRRRTISGSSGCSDCRRASTTSA